MGVLQLPYPPTANNLFKNIGKGRARTSGYNAWLSEAGWVAKEQRPAPVKGAYRLQIVAMRPDRRRRDIGNLEKPVSDLLVKLGLIEDDANAQSIFLGWAFNDESPFEGVLVSIEPAEFPIFVMGRAA